MPDEIEDLVTLPGVGRKTANLVRAVAFDKDAHLRGHARSPDHEYLEICPDKIPAGDGAGPPEKNSRRNTGKK